MTNLELIIASLEELSNAGYQAKLWNDQIEGQQSSFTEAVCTMFDDAGLGSELDSGRLDQSWSQALCIKARQLGELVKLVDDTGPLEQTLNHPKMPAVRNAARELLELFVEESKTQTSASKLVEPYFAEVCESILGPLLNTEGFSPPTGQTSTELYFAEALAYCKSHTARNIRRPGRSE